MNRVPIAAALCLILVVAGGARLLAHESRPASLDILESASGTLEVTWKRPLQGNVGLRLVPRLSSGWLDRDPDDLYATGDYLIATWRVAAGRSAGLSGQTVRVEGLSGTLTDTLVRVQFADGTEQQALLRGTSPSVVLGGEAAEGTGRFRFIGLGMAHILSGPDHLLFVLGLILIVANRRKLVVTITGFTLGHSVTLVAASLLRLNLPLPLIDLLIALSILFLAVEMLRAQTGERSLTIDRPWIVAFSFGLLHGLGFASGLGGIGLRGAELVLALLQFNLGVEIAQLGFVFVVLSIAWLIRLIPRPWPRAVLRAPSYAVGVAGAVWVLERAAAVFGS